VAPASSLNRILLLICLIVAGSGTSAHSLVQQGRSSAKPSLATSLSAADGDLTVAGRHVEVRIATAGGQSVRISLMPLHDRAAAAQLQPNAGGDGANERSASLVVTSLLHARTFTLSGYRIKLTNHPLRISIATQRGAAVQDLEIDEKTGTMSFALGQGPLFGLGAGGPQFSRRGYDFPMHNDEDAYHKPQFGGRLPIGWLLGDHWALFLNLPEGAIDLRGERGLFTPSAPALPLDIFVTGFKQPAEVMREYARITGFPSMPPVWALGYQQSHRTITSWQMLYGIASTFREKKLPCDVLIYLGTGFAPSGWNTGHGSFTFNSAVFPDPAADIRTLHDLHFRVVLHDLKQPDELTGRAADRLNPSNPDSVANYWSKHVPVERLGIDGWWPDEGENLDRASRLARIRMYWEGPQLVRPNLRPYTLNRTGYASMQAIGGWLWSGDTTSSWETLADQVEVGINTSLSGIPYWGTDIGGFFSTRQLTGELFVRWFEFGAFTPLFRAHGRPSATRYPWSWNSGQIGNPELSPHVKDSAPPDLKELHNPAVEPICRKYLDLRYSLMPYLYSAAFEAHRTGLPIMRALWLYYSDDPNAKVRGDEYLWGRDLLVAPVTEKGATTRSLYLPRGEWYDFWTSQRVEGGREVTRPVDLATIPLYARAGAIIPTGPVKQYTTEKVRGPLTLTIYPGADGSILLYDDDGVSFNFRRGEFTTIQVQWNDTARRLTIAPQHGSQIWNELSRDFVIRMATGGAGRHVRLASAPQTVQF
jgi:hypothetical protein